MTEQVDVTPGKIRERVKKGELDPKDVLQWLKGQAFPDKSERLERWLKNKLRAKRSEAKEQPPKKEQIKQRGKPRRRKKKNEGTANSTGK